MCCILTRCVLLLAVDAHRNALLASSLLTGLLCLGPLHLQSRMDRLSQKLGLPSRLTCTMQMPSTDPHVQIETHSNALPTHALKFDCCRQPVTPDHGHHSPEMSLGVDSILRLLPHMLPRGIPFKDMPTYYFFSFQRTLILPEDL